MQIETTIGDDVPCVVHVTRYMSVAPNRRANNDMDYYGYTECDWHAVDLAGNTIDQLTDEDLEFINDLIDEEYEK